MKPRWGLYPGVVFTLAVALTAAAQTAKGQTRETAECISNGKTLLTVRYGRPAEPGRDVFGKRVPYRSVWRTGDGEATSFVTESNLTVFGAVSARGGGQVSMDILHIPKGSYTMYTLPEEKAWLLIINRQTGQQGSEYHPEQDVARVPMRVQVAAQPAAQLTISLSAAPNRLGDVACQMKIGWDTTETSVAFITEKP